MDEYNRIYPGLPNNPDPINFRLQKSSEVLQNLEKEIRHYEEVRKKYNRARGIFTKISVCGGMISVILSASGLGTSLLYVRVYKYVFSLFFKFDRKSLTFFRL